LQGATTWILLLASFVAAAALLLCRFQRVVLPSLSSEVFVFIFFCVLSLQLRGLPARDDLCGSLLMYLLCAAASTGKIMGCVSPLVESCRPFQPFATEKPQQKPVAVAVTTDGQTATDKRKKSLKNSTPLSRLAHSRCNECDGHPDRYPSLPRSLSLSSLGFFRSTHLLPGAEVEVFGVLCSSVIVFRRGFLQGMR